MSAASLAFVSPFLMGQRKVKRSADSWQGRSKKAQAYLHSVRVQSLRMHVIHMLFVTIIAAGLIANERRSVVFSQKSA